MKILVIISAFIQIGPPPPPSGPIQEFGYPLGSYTDAEVIKLITEKIAKDIKVESKRDKAYKELIQIFELIEKPAIDAQKDADIEEKELLKEMVAVIKKLVIKSLLKDICSDKNELKEKARINLLAMGESVIKELGKSNLKDVKKVAEELDKLVNKIKQHIKDLGNDDVDKRESAFKELLNYGNGAIPWLEKAKDDTDAERSARAVSLIETIKKKLAESEKLKEIPVPGPFPGPFPVPGPGPLPKE